MSQLCTVNDSPLKEAQWIQMDDPIPAPSSPGMIVTAVAFMYLSFDQCGPGSTAEKDKVCMQLPPSCADILLRLFVLNLRDQQRKDRGSRVVHCICASAKSVCASTPLVNRMPFQATERLISTLL